MSNHRTDEHPADSPGRRDDDNIPPPTPHMQRRTPPPPNAGHHVEGDPGNTPQKTSANATHNSVDQPQNKGLRPIYTGLEGMANNLSEIDIEKMFDEYVPGEDPSVVLLNHCLRHCDVPNDPSADVPNDAPNDPSADVPNDAPNDPSADVPNDATIPNGGTNDAPNNATKPNKPTKESDLNPILCKLAHSVFSFGRVSPTVVVRDISNWQVSDEDSKRGGTQADCAVYFNNDRTRTIVDIPAEEFMKKSKMNAKELRKDWVGHRAWGDIVALIEIKFNHDIAAFEFKNPDRRFVRDHTDLGRQALGQFAEYIAHIMAHQHRTHVFALYVFRDEARICYFDRSGGVISKPFHYGKSDDTTLLRFFYRLSGMTREQLGFDPTATLASEEVVHNLRTWAATLPSEYLRDQVYQALCWNTKTGRSSSVEWPTHEIVFKGKTLYVGKPAFSNLSLFGRSTRGYVAIEKESGDDGSTTYALRYMKDSWRIMHPNIHPEHEVYERLASRGVSEYIPTCLGGEDVPDASGVWQQTMASDLMASKPLPRGHYRILLKEVCRPLSHFSNFAELALVLGDALSAHRDAWVKAEVLHRDISYNNILICERKNENGNDIRVGLLTDWDLSKYKEYMVEGFGPRQPDRTGTWYFKSAISQKYPTKPYAASDDIESFVHVFDYCVLRFHETGHSHNLTQYVRATYEGEAKRAADGAHFGGESKFLNMLSPLPHIIPRHNPTLLALLQEITDLCAAHYATIDQAEYDRRYDPPAPPPAAKALPEPVTTEPAFRQSRPLRGHNNTSNVSRSRVSPRPTLQDHGELLDVFWKWGTCEWAAQDLKKSPEDLFKQAGLAASKDNAFGSSRSASGLSQSSGDVRALKKVKRNDGTPLPSVEEHPERLDAE